MIDNVSLAKAATHATRVNEIASEKAGGAGETTNFTSFLSKAVESVNTDQVEADQSVGMFLTGQQSNLHDTMIQLEKADISMRLLVQVRNKAVDAYREIMRMQI